jgi:hypothetical protein
MDKDKRDLRLLALEIMRDQIKHQFESCAGLDNKASWLMGFLAVVFTIFFSTQTSKVTCAVLILVGTLLLVSFILCIISLLVPLNLMLSPGVGPFKKFIDNNIDDNDVVDSLTRLLSEDYVDNFEGNARKLVWKRSLLHAGYILLLAALIVMFVKAIL